MKTILVAAHELSTREKGEKGAKGERVKVAVGTRIDAAVKKTLGLDEATIDRLRETGAIVEVPVAVSTVVSDEAEVADLRERVAVAERRATDAEARAEKAEAELNKLQPAS